MNPVPGSSPADVQSVGFVRPEKAEAKSESAKEAERKEGLLTLARDRFKLSAEAENDLRVEQLEDKRFRAGQQWGADERTSRKKDKLATLTVNRIPQFLKQITGAQRANRPQLTINPIDDFGDPDTAEVLNGIVKHIEAISHADVAYDTAVEDQATMGRGYFRLLTEYEDEYSDGQEIKIRRIRNAHTVYYDPRCQEPDYSDALFAFVVSDYTIEEFNRTFANADIDAIDNDAFNDYPDHQPLWFLSNTTIRVAEYFYVDFIPCIVWHLSDGRAMPSDEAEVEIELSKAQAAAGMAAAQAGEIDPNDVPGVIEKVKERPGKKRKVRWAKINGLQVLEEGEWAGKWIPIIPVLGDEIDLDGKMDYRGIVRDMRDQQRVYNYQVSELITTMQMASKAPYVIAAEQVEGYEKFWKTSNMRRWAYLPYKAHSAGGVFAPPPQRNTFEPAIQAIMQSLEFFDNAMKATTGFYDASLGERGPEQSGKAILARQKQGEIGSIHYVDNLGRAMWALGRQLVDLIPKIYDAPRVVRIVGKDDQKRAVMVHSGPENAPQGDMPKGVKGVYDLGLGRYDVVCNTGPNTDTQRQETVLMLQAAIQANPELMQIIGDLYFGAMDWPKARQISERLKKFLPPQARDEEGDDDPESLKAVINQLQNDLQQRTAMLEEALEDIRVQSIQANAKKEIELIKAKNSLVLAVVDRIADAEAADKQAGHAAAADERKARMGADADDRKAAIGEAADSRKIAAGERQQGRDHAFTAQSSERDRQLQLESQSRDQQHQAQTQNKEQGLHQADTILAAQIADITRQQDTAEQERIREEQRNDAAQTQQHESQEAQKAREFEAKTQMRLQAAAPALGAKKPAAKKKPASKKK
jgi:hypothetical protein